MSDGELLAQSSPEAEGVGNKVRRIQWVLWLQWVLAGAVGSLSLHPVAEDMLWPAGLCLVWTLIAQWLVLRKRLARAGWWVLATLVGLALGAFAAFLVIFFPMFLLEEIPTLVRLLGAGVLGAVLGLVQWLVLRRQVRDALWWVPATVVAWVVAAFVPEPCLRGAGPLSVAEWCSSGGVALAVLGGATYGAITGAVLIVLLPHPVEARRRKPSQSLAAPGGALASAVVICLLGGILVGPINEQHLLVQRQLGRGDFFAASLEGANLSGVDLSEANLRYADLTGANLYDADLSGANLHDADLSGADLSGADLIEAHLDFAKLEGADLTGVDLTGASLHWADLTRADLTRADLTGANLREANLEGATVTQEQLAQAEALEGAIMPDGTLHE